MEQSGVCSSKKGSICSFGVSVLHDRINLARCSISSLWKVLEDKDRSEEEAEEAEEAAEEAI